MQKIILLATLATTLPAAAVPAAAAPGDPAFRVTGSAEAEMAGDPRTAPVAATLAWLTQNAPECPATIAPEVAARFVEQIRQRYPADVDRLGTAEFPLVRFESLLWQTAATRLSGSAYAGVREVIALRRIRSVQGGKLPAAAAEAAMGRIKATSAAAHRRLLEGRMDDDELLPLVEERRPDSTAKASVAAPKVLSAAEIISEFSRRNQAGAAVASLRAYLIEASITNPDGTSSLLWMFKLRPDLFRVHIKSAAGEIQVVAYDGSRFWRQAGPRVAEVTAEALGPIRYLTSFIDPLFEPESYSFSRLENGTQEGRPCHRIQVKRADGSGYIVRIDAENFHQVGRENPDGSSSRYEDFREVAGLTLAHRETNLLPDGTRRTLVITRIAANPGLISAFFLTPSPEQLDLAPLEQVLAGANNP